MSEAKRSDVRIGADGVCAVKPIDMGDERRRSSSMRRIALLVLLAACKNGGSGDDADDGDDVQQIDARPGAIDANPNDPDAVSAACNPVAGVPALAVTTVASGLDMPVFATAPKNDDRLFILEKATGAIRILKNGDLLATPFITLDVSNAGSLDDERGLLGLAFAPDYASSGLFYVFFVNNGNDEEIDRYQVSADADVADAGSRTQIWVNNDPATNHNGGTLAFGQDGYLYFGVGDGGGAEDPSNNGQNIDILFGKMMRIDVSTTPYSVPASNPFVGTAGADEIWSYGLRNPYRWSFDRETGDMYIGDVGQYEWEEIDVEPVNTPGRNYGWRVMEGTHCFNPATGCNQTGKTLPVYNYDHNTECAVVGGYVYRGCNMPGWHGVYFFADYCGHWVRSFEWDGSNGITNLISQTSLYAGGDIVAFGEDGHGELYIVRQDTGIVQKIVPE
jgi:glucose/arabinose dehydrogenase